MKRRHRAERVRTAARRAAALLLLPLLLAAARPGQAAALSPEESLREADQLEKTGAFRKALDIYAAFLGANPDHVQALNVRYRQALCHDSIGQPEEAMQALARVVAPGADRAFARRAEAFLRLAKLQGEAGRHEAAVKTLEALLKEGAGLYEDEAQNLCGGYYALLGRYDEAAVMFNVLQRKPGSPFAREAAYKLAVVWLKAGNTELATAAVEAFAQRYPAHPRTVELFLRIARHHFENGKYRSAIAVCSQVQQQFGSHPEAMDAAFTIALCYREGGRPEEAIRALEAVAAMPQAAHNSLLASECLFEIAQLCRAQLKAPERAMPYYERAAERARDPLTDRQQRILEHSLFYLAEHHFARGAWAAALDLYLRLRDTGTKLNVLGRVLHCQSKLDRYGEAALSAEGDEERRFVEQKIAANPGTAIALQGEVFLLDADLDVALAAERTTWPRIEELAAKYAALPGKYAAAVLAGQDMGAYIRMRQAHAYAWAAAERGAADPPAKWRAALGWYEEALAQAPEGLFRVEALEGVAAMAERLGEKRKAFDTYKRLFELTGRERKDGGAADAAADAGPRAGAYIRGLSSIADTPEMVMEAIALVQDTIRTAAIDSPEGREARFYLGELCYMTRRYSDAAQAYKDFIRRYGPPLDAEGNVAAGWQRPKAVDVVLDRVYEAGLRLAQCWYMQNHTRNMVDAYRWIMRNQDCLNPRVAEAAYVSTMHTVQGAGLGTIEQKEQKAEALWKRVVNPSLDVGSRAFAEGCHHWIRHPVAVPYVKAAILKSAELFSEIGRHDRAAAVLKEYVRIYDPAEKLGRNAKVSRFPRDDMYDTASYALGRELIQVGDYDGMAAAYRPYVDGLRDAKFRPSILMLLGHYGTEGGLFQDAREAYAALLDEFGPPNPPDAAGRPVPVPPAERLRPGSSWNGVRAAPPANWDAGRLRYALGYLHWKAEDPARCRTVLAPFVDDHALREHASRPEALYMCARSCASLKDDREAQRVLGLLVTACPRFKAVEEAYVELAAACFRLGDWNRLAHHYAAFAAGHEGSLRRPYMDLYRALGWIGEGRAQEGAAALEGLVRSDAFEDLKALACYHLAAQALAGARPDPSRAFDLLERSVGYYAQPEALLLAGRCAVTLERWEPARTYLDRCLREFPRADAAIGDEARALLVKVAEAEARARR